MFSRKALICFLSLIVALVTVIPLSATSVQAQEAVYLETGISHIPLSGNSFKTLVDRNALPDFAKDFTLIQVLTSNDHLHIRDNGTLAQYAEIHTEPYYETGNNSGVPGPGTWYALTVLYDSNKVPLAYTESMVTLSGGSGSDGGNQQPQQPPVKKDPRQYGSDIDPNYNQSGPQLFSDVGTQYWAHTAINDLAQREVIGGYPDGKYRPEKIVTRAELAKIMVLAAGIEVEPVKKTSFSDVKPTDWHAPYVEAAKYYLNGYALPNGKIIFDPNAPALREDLAVAIVKLRGYDVAKLPDLSIIEAMFTDYDSISEYARNYVSIAVESKLVSGFPDDTFRAQQPVNRAQAAAMLWRAYQIGNNTKLEQKVERVKVEFPVEKVVVPVPVEVVIPVPVPIPGTVTDSTYGG